MVSLDRIILSRIAIMKTLNLRRSLTVIALGALIWQPGTIAQATPRGESGMSYGSEVSGNPEDHNTAKPKVSAAAIRSIAATKSVVTVVATALQQFESGNTYAMQTPQGAVSIAVTAPAVAAVKGVNVENQSAIALVMGDATKGTPVQRQFEIANPKTAARVSATLVGVLQGLQGLNTSTARVEQAIAMTTKLGNIPQSQAIVPEQLASRIVVLLSLVDQLPQDKAIKGNDRVLLSDAINAYNDLVKTASPEVVVALAQQTEFQSVESELRGLRAMAGK
jgi:hypothetical protein